jgi:hypothetical protein
MEAQPAAVVRPGRVRPFGYGELTAPSYIRYRSTVLNRHGLQVGVFALVNGLAHDGVLMPEEEAWRRASNGWYDAAYADPAIVDPLVYDRSRNPGAVSWFKSSATHLIVRIDGYLALLDAYGVPWERAETDRPGRVIYEDDVQVVATPND